MRLPATGRQILRWGILLCVLLMLGVGITVGCEEVKKPANQRLKQSVLLTAQDTTVAGQVVNGGLPVGNVDLEAARLRLGLDRDPNTQPDYTIIVTLLLSMSLCRDPMGDPGLAYR